MERLEYFINYIKFCKEMKDLLSRYLADFEIYVFGSAVRGDFSPGLSDIDVAVVSDELENREKKLQIYDILLGCVRISIEYHK